MESVENKNNQTATRDALLLGLVLLVGLLLRLWNIHRESPWLDEVFSLYRLSEPSLAAFWAKAPEKDYATQLVPLYYTLEYLWARLFGASVPAMRALSMLFGMGAIPLVYALGKRLFSARAGRFAALCVAMSLPLVFYSQEIRRYALDIVLVLGVFHTLIGASETGAKRAWWPAHLGLNVLLVWCSVYTVPVLAAQAVYLAWVAKPPRRRWLIWCGANGASLAAYGLWVLRIRTEGFFWIGTPGWREVVNTLVVFAGGRFSNDHPAAFLPTGVSLDLLLAALLFGLAAWGVLRWDKEVPARATVLLWLLLPTAFWFAVSLVWKPCFMYRFLLFCSPALYLLAGAGFARLPSQALRAMLCVAVMALFAYQHTVRIRTPFRPDYRAAAAILQEDEGTPVLVLKDLLNAFPLSYAGHVPQTRIEVAHGAGDLEEKSLALLAATGELWVVMWRWDGREAYESFLRSQRIRIERRALGGLPPLQLYRLETASVEAGGGSP